MIKKIVTSVKRSHSRRSAYKQLSKLSDNQLKDIGLQRCNLKFVAAQQSSKK